MKPFLALAVVLILACGASFSAPYPPPPCGYHGVDCGGGFCCDEDEACGPAGTKNEGLCLYEGEPAKFQRRSQ